MCLRSIWIYVDTIILLLLLHRIPFCAYTAFINTLLLHHLDCHVLLCQQYVAISAVPSKSCGPLEDTPPGTAFPHDPKVEGSYETFPHTQRPKVKKRSPF